jgi:hypothetical protein
MGADVSGHVLGTWIQIRFRGFAMAIAELRGAPDHGFWALAKAIRAK